jgi:hypothetical protein
MHAHAEGRLTAAASCGLVSGIGQDDAREAPHAVMALSGFAPVQVRAHESGPYPIERQVAWGRSPAARSSGQPQGVSPLGANGGAGGPSHNR